MKNIFTPEVTNEVIERIHQLKPETQPVWGKMSVDKMMAHINISYEMVYEDKHPKPNGFKKFLLTLLLKGLVTGDKPYSKNSRTAPEFLITEEKNFINEKNRLIQYLEKTQSLGETHFDGKESHSFGKLTKQEWSTMFFKHLDHHLTQFGV